MAWVDLDGLYLLIYSRQVTISKLAQKITIMTSNFRSACLQRLGKSGLSLEDIDTAVAAGYPKDKLYKVH